MRSWQKLVTSSYSIRTSPIEQSRICLADTIFLLHVAYTEHSAYQTCSPLAHTEQSAHQTSNPNIVIDICVHTYSPLRAVALNITMAVLIGAFFKQLYGNGSQI